MSAIAQPVSTTAARPARKPSGWSQLKLLLPYVSNYKRMVAAGLVALTLTGLAGALPQLIIGTITDCLQAAPRPLSTLSGTARVLLHPLFAFYAPLSRHSVGLYCIILVAVMLVKGFFSFWTRWILIGVSREIEYDLRNDLLARLVLLDPEFYARNRTGDLMSRVTNDLNAVRMVLGPGIMYTANTIATSVLAVYFMAKLSAALTLWVLLPVPLVVVSVWYFGQVIHRLSEQIQAALGVLSTRAQENLTGMRVIRAYVQEKPEIESFDRANRDYVDRNIKLIGTWSLFFPALAALIGLTIMILLGLGGAAVVDHRVSLGTFLAFYSFLIQLVFPMIAIGFVTNIFQRGAASMGRLNYVLNAQPNIRDTAVSEAEAPTASAGGNGRRREHVHEGPIGAKSDIRGEIEFRHLTFTYPTGPNGTPGPPVLRDISLHVPAGSTLAIVGPTGSGKSTLAALIARLWEAPPGTLFIDGRPIREYPLETLRRGIGYVPQDTFLFSETIRENIAFGVEDSTEEHVLEAAEIASISGEILSFPARFDTMVGERGITLSGGQKQRTSLARAILRQPRILVLDDSLSSVDTDTEERILRRLRDVMRQRTTILIAHRISTVKGADQIVVMREGQVVERGTHEELLALGGYYADLYQKQLLEEELERE
ncbi:MAG TPA: ABC transporter ATP-binding protein [Candidatus Acidoferrales bacterium]|nr:ABC transporter ATP-binding protein [Candidatus Acidoferrales bacterium]